jgi:hypothetical protein
MGNRQAHGVVLLSATPCSHICHLCNPDANFNLDLS